MALLRVEDAERLRIRFTRDLAGPVTLTLVTSSDTGVTCVPPDAAPPLVNDANRPYLPLARQVVDEVSALSPLITVKVVHHSVVDDTVAEFRITHVPTILVQGADVDRPLYYVGTPLGYEFTTLVDGIVDASQGKTRLSLLTIDALAKVTEPATIKVFVTPSCPHCPGTARLAQQFGMVNPLIRAEVVEIGEFPDIADQYEVSSVPKSVMNGEHEVVGALPEAEYLKEFLSAVGVAD
ncbi:MAG TPA: thioredoxin family protein [Clostridia bacterium]|nr:thioredoxin family protein [Clostridia bacterium]